MALRAAFQRYIDKKLERTKPDTTEVDEQRRTVLRRIETLRTGEVLDWLDQSVYEIGKWSADYRNNPEPVYLDEIRFGLRVVETIVGELEQRKS